MERSRKLDTFQFREINKIFTHGYNPRILTKGQSVYSTNTLIVTTKYYIFKSPINKNVPNINGLKNKLKRKYGEQFSIHSECDYREKLYTTWGGG